MGENISMSSGTARLQVVRLPVLQLAVFRRMQRGRKLVSSVISSLTSPLMMACVRGGPAEIRSLGRGGAPPPVRSCLRRSASVSAASWAVRLRSAEARAEAPARRSSHCRSASSRSCSRPPARASQHSTRRRSMYQAVCTSKCAACSVLAGAPSAKSANMLYIIQESTQT